MKDLNNWFERIDQLAISITIIPEFLHFVLKEFEDGISGLAVLEGFGKWILGQVYPSMCAVVSQGYVENELKIGRGDHCRGHGAERRNDCVRR